MNGIAKKFQEKYSYPINIYKHDRNVKYLIGWPGYRVSEHKSGLGYVETRAELAHMQGIMLCWLLTGKFITHNPIFLFFMTLFGILVGIIPFAMLLTEIFVSRNSELLRYLFPILLPCTIIGIGLVINVFVSMLNPDAKSITGD